MQELPDIDSSCFFSEEGILGLRYLSWTVDMQGLSYGSGGGCLTQPWSGGRVSHEVYNAPPDNHRSTPTCEVRLWPFLHKKEKIQHDPFPKQGVLGV